MDRAQPGVPSRPWPLRGTGTLAQLIAITWTSGSSLVVAQALISACLGVAPVLAAWLTRELFDNLADLSGQATATPMVAAAVGIATVAVITVILGQLTSLVQTNLQQGIGLTVQGRLFRALNLSPGIRHFEDPRYLDRLQMAQQFGPQAPSQILSVGLSGTQGLITVIGFLLALLVIGWPLCVLLAASTMPGVILDFHLNRLRSRTNWQNATRARKLFFFATLQTDYQVCKELRLFGFGNFLHARMQGSQREINAAMSHVNAAQAKATALGSTVSSAITGVGLVWVVLEVSHGALPLGDVALFLAAAIGLQGSLVGILQGVPQMQQALIGFGHFRSIVEGPPDLAIPTTAMPVPPLERAIRFEDVWFRYTDDQPWVLQDVNVSIAAHETTGIVGVNGSGKSTLVKLLCRFYDPTRGRVLWDGVDIRQFAPEALRNRMSVLLQDFGCYEFTVRENIALSDLGKARDDLSLQKAAAVADLNETIDALAHGYDTLLSRMFFPHETESPEQGVRLSGGEWQRLAVARVALRTEADLIVLDEMTSGLDPAAEEKVGIRMRELTAGRTTIVISHRLGSIRPAAEIVVLMQGQIAEHGTHAELVRLGGEYARLFELQAAPFRA